MVCSQSLVQLPSSGAGARPAGGSWVLALLLSVILEFPQGLSSLHGLLGASSKHGGLREATLLPWTLRHQACVPAHKEEAAPSFMT